nr:MAG: bppU [Bacteriophage sp.]
MNVNQEVRLNLSTAGIPPRLSMPQGDANSRTIVATLWDGATPYNVPASAAVMVRFRKPDGTGGLYDATEAGTAVTASGNTVTAPVATQMLAVAGVVQAEIDIYGTGSGKAADRLATFLFAVEVTPSAYPDAQIISSDYYNIVADDIAKAVSAAAKAEEAEKGAVAAETAAKDYATEANAAKVAAENAKTGAQTAKTAAETAKGAAEDSAENAEAWAVGQRNGVDVPSTDPAYHNNAKYYKDQAKNITGGEFVSYGTPQTLTDAQKQQARENINALGGGDDVAKESTSQLVLSTLRGQRPKRYGYRVKESEANPSSRVEYLFDAVDMTPAAMNYTAGAFSYGSWADVWFVRDNVPYMVNNDGSVAYQLDPNDYTKKAVTGAESDVANTAFGGNAMSAIPLVWVKRYQENGYRYVIFCETQYDEGYKAYAHTRPDGTISPFAYGSMFEGSKIDTKLRSLSGQAPMSNLNAMQELTAAQANGDKWTLTTWAFWNLIHDLLVLIGKSTNIQAVFGQGHTTGGTSAADLLATGALNTKGQFFGYSDTTHSVKVFHMENSWGDRWDRLVGLIYDNGTYKAKMTPENGGYNITGAGYDAVRKGINATEAGGGWVKNAQQTEQGLFPTVLNGSDATYDCDYLYYDPSIVSVPAAGGVCSAGSRCGRCLNVSYVAAASGWNVGASLFLQNPS